MFCLPKTAWPPTSDSYEDIQSYLKESSNNFGMDKMEQILECLNIDETIKVYETTCLQIPDLFLDIYEDLLVCLGKLYKTDINNYTLDADNKNAFRQRIVNLLNKEVELLQGEFKEINITVKRLNILIDKFSQPKVFSSAQSEKNLNNLIIKFIAAWGNLINRYHVATNMYLDEIYPKHVEAVYSEVMNSLINNIFDFLSKLLDKGEDLSHAQSMLEEYFSCLMENS